MHESRCVLSFICSSSLHGSRPAWERRLLAQACGAPGISPSLSQVELPGPIPMALGLGAAGLSCPPGCFTNAEMLRLLLFNQTSQSLAAAALHAGDTPRTVGF